MIALKTEKHVDDYWEVMNNVDYKFAAIPAAFLLIRIWSLISDIIYVYVGLSPDKLRPELVYALMYSLVRAHMHMCPCSHTPSNIHNPTIGSLHAGRCM